MPSDPAEPLLKEHVDEATISKAAWILEDAVFGKNCDYYPEGPEAREYHIKCQKAEKLYTWALLGLVMLSVVEVPSWCRCHVFKWQFLTGAQRCDIVEPGAPDDAVIFLSGIPYIPPGYGALAELTCMAIVLRKFLMQWAQETRFFQSVSPSYHYGDRTEILIGIFITLLGFADCTMFFMFRNHFRIVLITRSGLLLMLPSVRNLARIAFAVIWEVCSIMAFLFGTILMFAWVAVTLFHDFNTRNIEGVMIDEGFHTFSSAVYSMFLASVTEEGFIDHFLPTFTAFRVTGFLWLFFLVLVHLLLLNLVLDTLVAGYVRVTEEDMKEGAWNQADGVLRSFAEVCAASTDGSLELSKQGFMLLLAELGRSPYVRKVTPNIAAKFFEAVDSDGSGLINQEEFIEICKVMNYDFWITRYDSKFKDKHPAIWNSRPHVWFRDFYEREPQEGSRSWCGNFDSLMNWVLLINFGMIIVESYYDLQDWPEPTVLGSLELWFSAVYISELLLKLSVISWAHFWSMGSNQFDFFTTIILCANTALSASQTLDNLFHVDSRYANMLRVLRLLRVLKTVKRLEEVRFLTATIMRIVQLSREIMTLLAVIIFIFSQISVQMFGGLLYIGNPRLEGTEYKENNWYVINYNDFPMAFATWFVSLLVEFTPVLAEVLNDVAPIKYEWMIILFYYFTAVAVVFELVQAFTIEAFVSLYERKHEPASELFLGWNTIEEDFQAIGYRIHHCAIGGRGLKWDEALQEAFEKMFEKMDESNGEGESYASEEQGSELGSATMEKSSSHTHGSKAESGSRLQRARQSTESEGARKAMSILDFAHIGHLTEEEVQRLEAMSTARHGRRKSQNHWLKDPDGKQRSPSGDN